MISKKNSLGLFVACIALSGTVNAALAESVDSYPSKQIQIIVPFAAGGGSDTLARLVGQQLSERWKQPVIVQNRPGADGNIGAQFVANAPKDGYTLMVLDIGTLTMGPVFYKQLAFDPLKDFSPITAMTFSPHTLVVNPNVPATNLAQLQEFVRAKPDSLNFASHNNSASLAGHKLSREANLPMMQIPYKGAGAAMTDLIGGGVNVTLVSLLLASPHIKSGALKPIAVASPKRMSSAPDIPTLIELGVPGYVMGSWQSILAPAGTPPAVVEKLQKEVADILNQPEIKARLESQGAEIVGNSPAVFAELLSSQSKAFRDTAAQVGIEAQ
jgi:tripartite-type tricarboxylate transporter receptor subunit TctC